MYLGIDCPGHWPGFFFTLEFALPVSFGTMLLVLNLEDKSGVIEIVQDVF
jgi:hypothetical protein